MNERELMRRGKKKAPKPAWQSRIGYRQLRMLRWGRALLLAGVVVPGAAFADKIPLSPKRPPMSSAPALSTRPVQPAATTDLATQVELALLADPVTFPLALTTVMNNDLPELKGVVPNDETRLRALGIAASVSPGGVRDGMTVKPTQTEMPALPMKGASGLLTDAKRRLDQTNPHAGRGVEVRASPTGEVTLSGQVASLQEKLQLSRCLRGLPGCVAVKNELQVSTKAGAAMPGVAAKPASEPPPVVRVAQPPSPPSEVPGKLPPAMSAAPTLPKENKPTTMEPAVKSYTTPAPAPAATPMVKTPHAATAAPGVKERPAPVTVTTPAPTTPVVKEYPKTPPAPAAATNKPETRPMGELEMRVEMELLADPTTFPYAVKAQMGPSGLVELKGTVPNDVVRRRAMAVAAAVSPRGVLDNMTVQPTLVEMPTPLKNGASALLADAKRRLDQAHPQASRKVEVQTNPNGEVTLTGQVSTMEEKLRLSRCLHGLQGCVAVKNQIQVGSKANATMPPSSAKPANEPAPIVRVSHPPATPMPPKENPSPTLTPLVKNYPTPPAAATVKEVMPPTKVETPAPTPVVKNYATPPAAGTAKDVTPPTKVETPAPTPVVKNYPTSPAASTVREVAPPTKVEPPAAPVVKSYPTPPAAPAVKETPLKETTALLKAEKPVAPLTKMYPTPAVKPVMKDATPPPVGPIVKNYPSGPPVTEPKSATTVGTIQTAVKTYPTLPMTPGEPVVASAGKPPAPVSPVAEVKSATKLETKSAATPTPSPNSLPLFGNLTKAPEPKVGAKPVEASAPAMSPSATMPATPTATVPSKPPVSGLTKAPETPQAPKPLGPVTASKPATSPAPAKSPSPTMPATPTATAPTQPLPGGLTKAPATPRSPKPVSPVTVASKPPMAAPTLTPANSSLTKPVPPTAVVEPEMKVASPYVPTGSIVPVSAPPPPPPMPGVNLQTTNPPPPAAEPSYGTKAGTPAVVSKPPLTVPTKSPEPMLPMKVEKPVSPPPAKLAEPSKLMPAPSKPVTETMAKIFKPSVMQVSKPVEGIPATVTFDEEPAPPAKLPAAVTKPLPAPTLPTPHPVTAPALVVPPLVSPAPLVAPLITPSPTPAPTITTPAPLTAPTAAPSARGPGLTQADRDMLKEKITATLGAAAQDVEVQHLAQNLLNVIVTHKSGADTKRMSAQIHGIPELSGYLLRLRFHEGG